MAAMYHRLQAHWPQNTSYMNVNVMMTVKIWLTMKILLQDIKTGEIMDNTERKPYYYHQHIGHFKAIFKDKYLS